MIVWCNYKWLAKLPKIGDSQFIDCDKNVVLMTKHPAFKDKYQCNDKMLEKMKSLDLHKECRGLHFTCNPRKGADPSIPNYNVIYLDHLIHGDKKLLSTIVHEVSHLVDDLLKNANVFKVDTEIRAYMIQYYVEHIFVMMDFEFDTSARPDKKTKWNKKISKVKVKLVKKFKLNNTDEIYTLLTDKQINESEVKNVDMLFKTIRIKG